jgi:sirohydrochlorin ferrochelatase
MRDVSAPALVLASHGTRDPSGRAAIDGLRAAVAAERPGLDVVEAYVDEDVQQPGLTGVLAGRSRAVVVPALLSSGYHVYVDVAEAIANVAPRVVSAAALGPDEVLADVLAERLAEAGASDHEIVLAAAGSSDPRASADVERTAALLTGRIGRPVMAAYATASPPRITEAVATLRTSGKRVAVAAYVLAPGYFYDRIREVGVDVVTTPLLPHAKITELVLHRYDEAITAG